MRESGEDLKKKKKKNWERSARILLKRPSLEWKATESGSICNAQVRVQHQTGKNQLTQIAPFFENTEF